MKRSRSGGQGAGGNPGSGGPQPQGRRPEEDEPTTSDHAEGRPSYVWGKPSMANGVVVGEAGMRLLGRCGDIGKPSVLRTVAVRDVPRLGPRWQRARAAGPVDLVATRGRRDQGGGGSRTSKDAGGNPGGAKGSWSTKGHAEETRTVTSRGRERYDGATHPVLYEEPLREGEGAERPSTGRAWPGNNP